MASRQEEAKKKVVHVTSDSEYKSLRSAAGDALVIVDFSATW